MSAPISHKLIVRDDGEMFVVSGNPSVGYTCRHATLETLSEHKRSWQAVTAAHEWDRCPCGECGGALVTLDDYLVCSNCGTRHGDTPEVAHG